MLQLNDHSNKLLHSSKISFDTAHRYRWLGCVLFWLIRTRTFLFSLPTPFLTACFFLTSQSHAAILELTPQVVDINPSKYVSFIEDPTNKLTIKDIQKLSSRPQNWISNGDEAINLGFSASTFWLKLELKNSSNLPLYRLIEFEYPNLDELTAYEYRGDTQVSTLSLGNLFPVNNKIIKHRNYIFPYTIPAHSNRTIYFKAKGPYTIQLPMHLWENDTFWQQDQIELFLQFMYFGLMLVMIFYHAFIAWGIKDKIYTLYVVFLLALAGYFAIYKGIAPLYFSPNAIKWNEISLGVFVSLCNISTLVISVEILRLQQHLPKTRKVLLFFASISTLSIPLIAFVPLVVILPVICLVIYITSNMLIIASIYCWKNKVEEAPIFTIAYGSFLLGTCFLALNKFAIIPLNAFTEHSTQVGSAIETVLLSLALASRIKRLRKDSVNLRQAKLNAQEMRLKAIQEVNEGQAKSQFLAMMSHEIRTPLNGVLGLVEILKETPLSDKQKTFTRTIQSSGEMLLTIINDILDFSKADANTIETNEQTITISHLVDECGLIYSIKAMQKGVSFATYISPSTPKNMITDDTRLKQVLNNLLGNAFKFTDQGYVLLFVDSYKRDDQTVVRFEVTDTGIGIRKEQQERIFNSFSQADQATTRRYGGTGLGLTICKNIIDALRGRFGVDSEYEQGSTFWFELPVEEPMDHSNTKPIENNLSLCLVTDNQLYVNLFNKSCTHSGVKLSTIQVEKEGEINLSESQADRIVVLIENPRFPVKSLLKQLAQSNTDKSKIFWLQSYFEDLSQDNTIENVKPITLPFVLHHLLSDHHYQGQWKNTDQGQDDLPHCIQHLNVLVAEDNLVNQMVIKGLIKPLVASLHVVNNGVEAVEFYEKNHHQLDLIFMDCEMPEMDGYDATRAIRKMENALHPQAKIKIVALTAHAFSQFKSLALEAGMDDHLTKPINLKILKSFFSRHFNDSEQAQRSAILPNTEGQIGSSQ